MRRIVGLAILCFLIGVNSAYAANWTVKVVSDKDAYVLGEKAIFEIEVKKNNKCFGR